MEGTALGIDRLTAESEAWHPFHTPLSEHPCGAWARASAPSHPEARPPVVLLQPGSLCPSVSLGPLTLENKPLCYVLLSGEAHVAGP